MINYQLKLSVWSGELNACVLGGHWAIFRASGTERPGCSLASGPFCNLASYSAIRELPEIVELPAFPLFDGVDTLPPVSCASRFHGVAQDTVRHVHLLALRALSRWLTSAATLACTANLEKDCYMF